jgi:hypothetical protein
MAVAKFYGDPPDIFTKLSWNEARIFAGEKVGVPQIRQARGRLKTGRPRQTDQFAA